MQMLRNLVTKGLNSTQNFPWWDLPPKKNQSVVSRTNDSPGGEGRQDFKNRYLPIFEKAKPSVLSVFLW
jgi:hypothetical protein